MALERFADVVERFTHGYGNGHTLEPPAEIVNQWHDELERAVRRAENLQRMVTNPQEPRVGQTPRQEIYKKNKSRLYRYQSKRTHKTPLLFVPNLGISRPYIFDLMPGASFVEHMTREGFVDTVGAVPADMVKAGFKLLKPTMDLSTNLNLWWNLWNDKYVEGFNALNRWANEYVAFPGEFFRQWVGDFYQRNKLFRGEAVFGGRPARLSSISCPVFVVGAKEDYIAPPECVRALIDAVSSRDKDYVELPGGHISLIAGRGASLHCWPKVSSWLAPRS